MSTTHLASSSRDALEAQFRPSGALAPAPSPTAPTEEAARGFGRAVENPAFVPPPPRAASTLNGQPGATGASFVPPAIPAGMSPGDAWAMFTRTALQSADGKVEALRAKRQAIDTEIASVTAERAAIAAALAVWERRRAGGAGTTARTPRRSTGQRLGQPAPADSLRGRARTWLEAQPPSVAITVRGILTALGVKDTATPADKGNLTALLKDDANRGALVRLERGVYRRVTGAPTPRTPASVSATGAAGG